MSSAPSPPEETVHEVLQDWDPRGLIEMGLPEDEYKPEVDHICDHLENVQDREDAVDLLRGVFSHMFGREYSWDECEEAGTRLYERLQEE